MAIQRTGRRVFTRPAANAGRVFRGGEAMADTIQSDVAVKDASERVLYLFDFTKFPEYVAAETLTTPVVDAVTGLTIGTPIVSVAVRDGIAAGGCIEVFISGGTAGVTYNLECRGTFSGGAIRVVKGRLNVE